MSPEVQRALDLIDVNINLAGMNAINIVLAFVMFGVALDINPRMLITVFRHPKSVIVGMIGQFLILPALTFLLALSLKDYISPMIALGMILVAACPGGNISNFITSLSHGNTALSVSLSALSTAGAPIFTPANFAFWGNLYLNNAQIHSQLPELDIPYWEVVKTVFLLLALPMFIGLLCSHYFPKQTKKLKKPLKILSIVFFVLMVVLALGQNIEAFSKCIKYIFIIVLIHNLLALSIGFLIATLTKLDYKDRRTLTIEMGIQNSGLGLVLLVNPMLFDNFPPNGGMLIITAWWGVWHIVSGLAVSFIFKMRRRKQ